MPAVLVGPMVTQNSPFLANRWLRSSPVLIVPTHGGMTRLCRLGWLGYSHTYERSPIPVLTIPGIEQLRWSRPTRLPLSQTATTLWWLMRWDKLCFSVIFSMLLNIEMSRATKVHDHVIMIHFVLVQLRLHISDWANWVSGWLIVCVFSTLISRKLKDPKFETVCGVFE